MRDMQYSWGYDENDKPYHHISFFTKFGGWLEWTVGTRPSRYDVGLHDYDDCNMPKQWEPVSAVSRVTT